MTENRGSQRQRMLAGEFYEPGDPELCALRSRAQQFMRAYNQTIVDDVTVRSALLEAHLGAVGMGCAIRTPFYVDYGCNIYLADKVFMNYGCVLLDVCNITIGAGTQIGPGVQILTADHPRSADERLSGLEMGKPISVEPNVWIGGGAIILPGITIGEDAIVGAGSVVTRHVAPGTTVVGNPARPIAT